MKPNFERLGSAQRRFAKSDRRLVGPVPAIALTPVVDGRRGAYEDNQQKTWAMVERVYRLLADNVALPDGTPARLVVAPEIVYGARTGAIAAEYYAKQGVCANIFLSRSWAYSDELMSVCQGLGSSEWIQAAYGLNQTDRPGAVWLKAFCAAMDEKRRPIFSIYNPDLENEDEPITPYVGERLLRFARCAAAAGEMRGKNYLGVGGVSMGIIGSDTRRNIMLDYFGMGTVSVDMVALRGRMDRGFYDHDELEKAIKFLRRRFKMVFNEDGPLSDDDVLAESVRMALIVRDMMEGNPVLANSRAGKQQGFRSDIELAQGHNAIAAGTQGQRQWTDLYPNFDLTESIMCSSFDWNGFRPPYIVATENDGKNGVGMLAAHLISGVPQLFADIRTNWTPRSIKDKTGVDVSKLVPGGLIDQRNSGAGALDYAVDVIGLVDPSHEMPIQDVAKKIRGSKARQQKLISLACRNSVYLAATLEYFPGDGLSSHYRTPGDIPMTAYRYNVVGNHVTVSVVEGRTIELPEKVADAISVATDKTWPETYWAPRDMTSFEYMSKIGPNHDANSFGYIGADLLTLNAMLRIPVDMHNVAPADVFRPTLWDRFGGDDFRACAYLGPLYG